MLPGKRRKAPDTLIVATNLPSIDLSGLDILRDQIKKTKPDIVILDTLQRYRDQTSTKESYKQDYIELSKISDLSRELDIPFLILHHTRKDTSGPDIARVLGTYGIAGVVDGIIELYKDNKSQQYKLSVKGRDIEESCWIVEREEDDMSWKIISSDIGIQMTKKQLDILNAVRNSYPNPTTPKMIQEKTGYRKDYIIKTLRKMAIDNIIRQLDRGQYLDIIEVDEGDYVDEEWEDD